MAGMTKGQLLNKLHRMKRLAEQLPEDAQILEAAVNWRDMDLIQIVGEKGRGVEAVAEMLHEEVAREERPYGPYGKYRRLSIQVNGITVLELQEKGDQ